METIDSKRQIYLKEKWRNRFPISKRFEEGSSTNNVLHTGRILHISDSHLSLFSNGVLTTLKWDSEGSLEEGFSNKDVLAPGDIVEVQLEESSSSYIKSIRLLVPSIRENPFNYLEFDHRRAHQWQTFLKTVRDFFAEKNFVEISTPSLVPSPGLEPHLDAFHTQLQIGSKKTKYFLPTSPEFHLKKALSLGFERCFEIKTCFRNGELSKHHQPEFQMLEWYRAYEDSSSIMTDVKELFSHLQTVLELPEKVPGTVLMEELWKKELDFDLTPETSAKELRLLATRLGIKTSVADSSESDFDDLFTEIFLLKIEPKLAEYEGPVIVWHYPPSQAALARLTEEGWADRFEVYWRGLEIANAFHELNDPQEQRLRFLKDQEKKKELGKEVIPIDEEFMKALEWGMPPSAGIALGLERLFMALYQIEALKDVRLFPIQI